MKRDNLSLVGVSVTQDAKSPFWVAQWSLSNGERVKRSTKVPVEGGLFQGERLSKVQARKRALLVAQELAAAAQVEAERVDNLSVWELFDTVLKGKLGRLSGLRMLMRVRPMRSSASGWGRVGRRSRPGW